MKYQIIFRFCKKHSVKLLCKYLECSKSGFYHWLQRGKPEHNKVDNYKKEKVLEVYNQKRTRGRRQVVMQLKRQFNLRMSLGSVHRYMAMLNIQSKRFRRKSKIQLLQPKVAHFYENIIQQNFTENVYLTDITYLPSKDGLEYCSAIKSMKDKSIVAINFSNKNDLHFKEN